MANIVDGLTNSHCYSLLSGQKWSSLREVFGEDGLLSVFEGITEVRQASRHVLQERPFSPIKGDKYEKNHTFLSLDTFV